MSEISEKDGVRIGGFSDKEKQSMSGKSLQDICYENNLIEEYVIWVIEAMRMSRICGSECAKNGSESVYINNQFVIENVSSALMNTFKYGFNNA